MAAAMPVPDDLAADILRRLPPRTLAAARCVCKPWRDLVDGRALLLPHLLPHSVHGVVINYIDHGRPHLFSRPKSSSSGGEIEIDGRLSSVPRGDRLWCPWHVMDHCNGLLLCAVKWESRFCVHNPATRRWTTLPSPQPESSAKYLVFDPAVSPHYEVFSIPDLPEKPKPPPEKPKPPPEKPKFVGLDELLASLDGAEETWEIEEFVEEELPPSPSDDEIYWKMEWPPSPYRVEVFSSTSGRWEKREFVREEEEEGNSPSPYQVDAFGFFGDQVNGPWILEEDTILVRENKDHGWDSDNDDFLDTEAGDEGHGYASLNILGFHPYKEIIFLQETFRTAAYHLHSKKIQYLGYSRPKCYYRNHTNGIYESFVYTPCVIGELQGDYFTAQSSS